MVSYEKTGLIFGRREIRGRVMVDFHRKLIDPSKGLPSGEVNAGGTLMKRFRTSIGATLALGATVSVGSYTVPTGRSEVALELEAIMTAAVPFRVTDGAVIQIDDNGTILREFGLFNNAVAGTGLGNVMAREWRGQTQHEALFRVTPGATINAQAISPGGAVTATVYVNWAGLALQFA